MVIVTGAASCTVTTHTQAGCWHPVALNLRQLSGQSPLPYRDCARPERTGLRVTDRLRTTTESREAVSNDFRDFDSESATLPVTGKVDSGTCTKGYLKKYMTRNRQ